MTVGVVVPSIPVRKGWLRNAVRSIEAQDRSADEIIVEVDVLGTGASATRNRGWAKLDTDWVAFLDDDDVMYPQHLDHLLAHAEAEQADLVYPWYDVRWRPGQKPFEFVFIDGEPVEGHPFDDRAREVLLTEQNFIPVTVLVRRELLADVGGFPEPETEEWPHEANEDWGCWQRLLRAGALFSHLSERTWQWRWHQFHTMGRGNRW